MVVRSREGMFGQAGVGQAGSLVIQC